MEANILQFYEKGLNEIGIHIASRDMAGHRKDSQPGSFYF